MTVNQPTPQAASSNSELALTNAREYFSDYDILLNPPIMRAAYSDRMAWILASMSQLAYDRFEVGTEAKELLVTKLKGGGFNLLETFNATATDTQAILVANGDYAVLAFRGTEVSKKTDILTDARANRVTDIEGRVHSGFRNAFESVRQAIEKSLVAMENIPLFLSRV